MNFVPKVKLEIVVADGMADQVVETIQTTAKTDRSVTAKSSFSMSEAQCASGRARPTTTRSDARLSTKRINPS